MKLVGLMPVRNEAWCLGLTARAALMWVDTLICLNHASTDASIEILHDIIRDDPRLLILDESDVKWDEMQHRQRMLEMARQIDGTHIAMIDADEILTGNLLMLTMFGQRALTDRHCGIPESAMLQLPGYNLRGSLHRHHSTGIWANRWFSVAFADQPAAKWQGDRFHHREPSGVYWRPYRPIEQGAGGVMHLWGVSERRLAAKHALYKITERIRWPEKQTIETEYNLWRSERDERAYCAMRDIRMRPGSWEYANVPDEWWKPYRHLMRYLDLNAEPWQEAECHRLIEEYGAGPFRDLDLFGVV